MSVPVSPQLTDPDDSRDPVAELRDAMAAVNSLERTLFGRLIRRFIRSPKLGWVTAVNAVDLASATRALVAARWSTITFVSGLENAFQPAKHPRKPVGGVARLVRQHCPLRSNDRVPPHCGSLGNA